MVGRTKAEDIPRPQYIDRDDFLDRYWDYQPGQHVTFLAPTQAGKTTFMAQLAHVTATPELPLILMVMKPRDKVVDRTIETLNLRKVISWPPPKVINPFDDTKYRGWALWPKHTFDPDVDDANMTKQFRAAILDSYKRGDRILMADETFGLVQELKLEKPLNAVWTRGASMDCGLWAATQRPAFIPQNAYVQAEHVFMAFDPDLRSRERYAEIGGVNPVMIEHVVSNLPKYHWLYIRRTGRVAAIIGA